MKEKLYNILDYILMRGDLSFEISPFNSIDALILCQITYNNIDGLVSPDFTKKISVSKLWEKYRSAKDYDVRNNMGAMINPLTPYVLEAASRSNRFSNVNVSGFINKIDEKEIEQFCAVSYEVEKNNYVVVFRGTDDTIVGWYEDFNLGYMDEIPSQRDAAIYINDAMTALKGSFSIAGHSKGGNLSVKAGMSVEKKNLKRLETVYNFDGPGFFAPVYKTQDFLQIKDKIKSFFPEFCVVGMLFEHVAPFTIVSSSAEGVLQHDPFSWDVYGGDFLQSPSFDENSNILYASFNDWTSKLSVQERKKFIDTFFDVIYASGAKTNFEIEQNKFACGGKMLAKLSELDEDERKACQRAIKAMVKVAKNHIPMLSAFDYKSGLNEIAQTLKEKEIDLKEQIKKLRR